MAWGGRRRQCPIHSATDILPSTQVRSQCAEKPSKLAKTHATKMTQNRESRIGHLGELSGVLLSVKSQSHGPTRAHTY